MLALLWMFCATVQGKDIFIFFTANAELMFREALVDLCSFEIQRFGGTRLCVGSLESVACAGPGFQSQTTGVQMKRFVFHREFRAGPQQSGNEQD